MTDRAEEAVDDVTTAFVGDVLRTYRPSLTGDRRRLLASYRVVDVAREVGGVRLLGRDGDDPLVLQLKEAGPSVLERPVRERQRRAPRGRRPADDPERDRRPARMGEDRGPRPLRPPALGREAVRRVEVLPPRELATYAATCGEALARAHARSGDRFAIAAYLGRGERFADALVRFAGAYADQNEIDHAAFAAAVTDPER